MPRTLICSKYSVVLAFLLTLSQGSSYFCNTQQLNNSLLPLVFKNGVLSREGSIDSTLEFMKVLFDSLRMFNLADYLGTLRSLRVSRPFSSFPEHSAKESRFKLFFESLLLLI